jgi:DNA-binding GntR family transcriptional regulator
MDSQGAAESPAAVGEDSAIGDVFDVLRQRIASHEIPPGARLREQPLAEEFRVPRTRVREALSALDARGLVERVPNRGAVVARLDVDQLLDIYDVREVLEGVCARLATERAPSGSWDELVTFFAAPMQRFADSDDFDGFVEGYERFRQQVIAAADNPVLSDMLDAIYEKTQVAIRRIIILPGRADVGLAEHRAVLDAMASGDANRAEQLRRQNMRSAREFLVRYQSFVL